MTWSLPFQESDSSLFQWVVFAESLQDQIRANVSFKTLRSIILLYPVCILRLIHRQSRHHSGSSSSLADPPQLPAPAEPTSTLSHHLHGASSKQNLLPTLPA